MSIRYKPRYENNQVFADVEEVTLCPRCKKSIQPVFLSGYIHEAKVEDNLYSLETHLLCKACQSSFIAHYYVYHGGSSTFEGEKASYVAPNNFVEQNFKDSIKKISPQFVKIYNQASAAENYKLDEIAGIGYRKALEFLIKDYAISEHADESDKIKSMSLSQCIKRYIVYNNIKTLAERSAWLGNDETHYVRKHDNLTIQDMKEFIDALVHFILMELITKKAENIKRK